jgi:tRNA (guanine-N7-)-methyltransferase
MTYLINSAQTTIHPDLGKVLQRAKEREFEKPIKKQVIIEFERLKDVVDRNSAHLMLDSFCGTGHSTLALAQRHPGAFVIGFDQSEDRLNKAPIALKDQKNAILLRAEAVDLWRLFLKENWHFEKHTLFYPNPWPKVGHLRRRVHGHPVFPQMMRLSDQLELRSSWDIYAQEFVAAVNFLDLAAHGPERIYPSVPVSLFEKKYIETATPLYVVKVELKD